MEKVPINVIKKMIELNCCKITVEGHSMEPTLFQNDVVQITNADCLEINDIILYNVGDKYVLHRILDYFGDFVVTKGDNNKFSDHPIHKNNVLGKSIINEKTIFYPKNHNIVFNFWDKGSYEKVQSYAKMFDLIILNHPNLIFKDGINIAVSPCSTVNLSDLDIALLNGNQKIYIHIGAKISDFPCKGYIIYSQFDSIYRSGTFSSCYLLSPEVKFIILYNELELLRGLANG